MMKIDVQLHFVSVCQHPLWNASFSHYTKNYQEVDVYPDHWHSCREVFPLTIFTSCPECSKICIFWKTDMVSPPKWFCTVLKLEIHPMWPLHPLLHHSALLLPPVCTPTTSLLPGPHASSSLLSAPPRGRICRGSWPVLPALTGARPPPTWL